MHRWTELARKFGRQPDAVLSVNEIMSLPELQFNPFGRRLCQVCCDSHPLCITDENNKMTPIHSIKVFSDDGTGSLAFENFLDLLSVFSNKSSTEAKRAYIFRLYGM